jgi:hypothetical protein
MGMEYKLCFQYPDDASVNNALARMPERYQVRRSEGGFEFRSADNTGLMPDAAAHVEQFGAYFCDNGGAGREIMGIVVARLVSQFGVVTVAALE